MITFAAKIPLFKMASSLVPPVLKEKLDVIVFDMDQTILSMHTRGAVYQTKLEGNSAPCVADLDNVIVPSFRELVPLLVDNGFTGIIELSFF